jgi:peptidyl-prolyl cis-trans isomerase A (cyclophilin A)
VQFGLPGDPQLGRVWSSQVIPDDPVRRPNRRGTLAFASAGPNTRTTQLFINLADNLRLDALGFAPLGQVAERLGLVDSLYAQYGERPSQDSIRLQGNAYLTRAYPNLDYIRTARIVREWRGVRAGALAGSLAGGPALRIRRDHGSAWAHPEANESRFLREGAAPP